MPFSKSGRSVSSTPSQRPVSPLGSSRYEQPYTPPTRRRSPPHRSQAHPENLHVSSTHDSSCSTSPHPKPANIPQDLSSSAGGFTPNRQASNLQPEPASQPFPQLLPKQQKSHTSSKTEELPNFDAKPARLDELDMLGSHARRSTSAQGGISHLAASRSVLRKGPERSVRVVDAGIVERLMPGYRDIPRERK